MIITKEKLFDLMEKAYSAEWAFRDGEEGIEGWEADIAIMNRWIRKTIQNEQFESEPGTPVSPGE